MALKPCRHLDYTEGKYGPDVTLETGAPHFPDVSYWLRGPTWTVNDDGVSPPNPSKVQFCILRGRINGVFQCHTGELSCYEPSEPPAQEETRT